MSETKMTHEKFENMKQMLMSPDKDNHVLALTVLESLNYSENAAFLILCKKYSYAGTSVWADEAPNLMEWFKSSQAYNPDKTITYKVALKMLTDLNASVDQVEFYLEHFGKYLTKQLQITGYDFIDSLEFKIKLKPEYEHKEASGVTV